MKIIGGNKGVEVFCKNAGAVVFLTATPLQNSTRDLYMLLNLLRPGIVYDHDTFQMIVVENYIPDIDYGDANLQEFTKSNIGRYGLVEGFRKFLIHSINYTFSVIVLSAFFIYAISEASYYR